MWFAVVTSSKKNGIAFTKPNQLCLTSALAKEGWLTCRICFPHLATSGCVLGLFLGRGPIIYCHVHSRDCNRMKCFQIFWKARQKAKEDLNEQLADFQRKRTAGLGTLFGPSDAELDECVHDKSKELKTVEKILLSKLEPFMWVPLDSFSMNC